MERIASNDIGRVFYAPLAFDPAKGACISMEFVSPGGSKITKHSDDGVEIVNDFQDPKGGKAIVYSKKVNDFRDKGEWGFSASYSHGDMSFCSDSGTFIVDLF